MKSRNTDDGNVTIPMVGRFKHGKKNGTWKIFDEEGELLKTQTFR